MQAINKNNLFWYEFKSIEALLLDKLTNLNIQFCLIFTLPSQIWAFIWGLPDFLVIGFKRLASASISFYLCFCAKNLVLSCPSLLKTHFDTHVYFLIHLWGVGGCARSKCGWILCNPSLYHVYDTKLYLSSLNHLFQVYFALTVLVLLAVAAVIVKVKWAGLREAFKKKNCIFYDIVIIRETTYPPSLIMT